MVARGIRLREVGGPVPETDGRISQRKRPESGRFLLNVDRQTKASYVTAESAEAAGMAILRGHPFVQISAYNSAASRNTLVELPGVNAATPATKEKGA